MLYIQEKPRICPGCLTERNYCRRIWELLPLVVCPRHKCLLIERCPQCSQCINWRRPGVSVCQCRFDFRQANLTSIADSELRFGRYFYQKLKHNLVHSSVALDYPLNELNLSNLLQLVFFVAAHLNGIPEFTPRNTLADFSVQQIHKFLCEAVEVFDNWSAGYHQLIDEWQDKVAKYNLYHRPARLLQNPVPAKYKKYASLISELDDFDEEEFEFLHIEFLNYFQRRLIEI